MALQRINLIPQDVRSQSALNIDKMLLLGGSSIFLIIISMCAILFISKTENMKLKISLSQENEVITKQLAVLNASKANNSSPTDFSALAALVKNKSLWAEPFKELTTLMPNFVWLVSLSNTLKEGRRVMTFNGQAPSQEKVTEFFSLLENSYYFREVMMKYSERAKDFAPPLYVFEFSTSIEDSQKKGVAR